MKRIVFLDYLRVFACFLVMLAHACENYYGAEGSTMDNPLSMVSTETDRLWVSLYDGFSRMAVPLFMIVSAFLLVPMKAGLNALLSHTFPAANGLLAPRNTKQPSTFHYLKVTHIKKAGFGTN